MKNLEAKTMAGVAVHVKIFNKKYNAKVYKLKTNYNGVFLLPKVKLFYGISYEITMSLSHYHLRNSSKIVF